NARQLYRTILRLTMKDSLFILAKIKILLEICINDVHSVHNMLIGIFDAVEIRVEDLRFPISSSSGFSSPIFLDRGPSDRASLFFEGLVSNRLLTACFTQLIC